MMLSNIYLAAAAHRVNERDPLPSGPTVLATTNPASTTSPDTNTARHDNFAAQAAQAALTTARVDLSELGPVYHLADLPVPNPYMTPAVDLLRAAKLPASHHPLITMATGRQGVLDAITTAGCYLNQIGQTGTSALITAGDIWPIEPIPSTTPRQNAGAALVLSTQTGDLELTATATASDPQLTTLLSQPYSHASEREIRDRLAALLERVVTDALRDARVEPDEVHQVITPHDPDSEEHATILRQIDICTDTLKPDPDPDVFLARSDAVSMIARFALLADASALGPVGTPILVVADSGHGTASAAVIRVA